MRQAGVRGGSHEDKIRAGKAGALEDKCRAGKIGGQAGASEDKRRAGQAGAPEDKQRPRSVPVLAAARPGASLGHDFMTLRPFHGVYCVLPFFWIFGIFKTCVCVCPPTLPPGEFWPKTLCF